MSRTTKISVLAMTLLATVAVPLATSNVRHAQSLSFTNQTYNCNGPVNGLTVTVRITTAYVDAVHINKGCTGTLKLDVVTSSRDGLKLHDGAHDLTVTGGITCAGRMGKVHQDGVQAMGGARVTFENFTVTCPTSNNGAFFVSEGNQHNSVPTDIVCDSCTLYGGNTALVLSRSLRSGARNSRLAVTRNGGAKAQRVNRLAINPVLGPGNTTFTP